MTKRLMYLLAVLTFAGITDANGAANAGSVSGLMSHSSRLSFVTHRPLTRTAGLLSKRHAAKVYNACIYETLGECRHNCTDETMHCEQCSDGYWACHSID